METKVNFIKKIKSDKEVYSKIKKRLLDFYSFKDRNNSEWFSELCFCLLTANASAKGGIAVQKAISNTDFLNLSQKRLALKLKKIGYRFPNIRSEYIVSARSHSKIKDLINGKKSFEAREFLVNNLKGLGMKEASHFLRNVGYTDLAILDKHILRSMGEELKSLNKARYLKIESKLARLCGISKVSMAELDLILWYGQTGEILK